MPERGDLVLGGSHAGLPVGGWDTGILNKISDGVCQIITLKGEYRNYRRCHPISEEVRIKFEARADEINLGDRSVWDWARQFAREERTAG